MQRRRDRVHRRARVARFARRRAVAARALARRVELAALLPLDLVLTGPLAPVLRTGCGRWLSHVPAQAESLIGRAPLARLERPHSTCRGRTAPAAARAGPSLSALATRSPSPRPECTPGLDRTRAWRSSRALRAATSSRLLHNGRTSQDSRRWPARRSSKDPQRSARVRSSQSSTAPQPRSP